jgi:hypothetical protein
LSGGLLAMDVRIKKKSRRPREWNRMHQRSLMRTLLYLNNSISAA